MTEISSARYLMVGSLQLEMRMIFESVVHILGRLNGSCLKMAFPTEQPRVMTLGIKVCDCNLPRWASAILFPHAASRRKVPFFKIRLWLSCSFDDGKYLCSQGNMVNGCNPFQEVLLRKRA